jgi:hypothetical protein
MYRNGLFRSALDYSILTFQVNANDNDGGIIIGNWTGKYENGVSPTEWNGSVAIIKEWLKNKKGVKYAQCWVFCGVLTTSKCDYPRCYYL